ncbi:MAG: hypothetical protein EP318_03480 [Rhodobacteraceae bacterium]|nr:MAG: hypothetical protein EP318_03480 [Paracoccaceae bacterium]
MLNYIKTFRKDENGAVTVDWVVLCAAIVGLAIAAYTAIEDQTELLYGQASGDVESQIGE